MKSWRSRSLVLLTVAVLLATAGYGFATRTLVEVPAAEGTWKLAQSRYVDEQGFIFLVGGISRAQRDYPMPGGPPNWLFVGDDYVYAGRIGDGAMPDSGLVRIDRNTLEATVVAIPLVNHDRGEWADGWLVATPEEATVYAGLVGYSTIRDGAKAESWTGPVVIDTDGIDEFIEQIST